MILNICFIVLNYYVLFFKLILVRYQKDIIVYEFIYIFNLNYEIILKRSKSTFVKFDVLFVIDILKLNIKLLERY